MGAREGYEDAQFTNKADALAYLNRGPAPKEEAEVEIKEPSPDEKPPPGTSPTPPESIPDNPDDSWWTRNAWWVQPAAGVALGALTLKFGPKIAAKLLKKPKGYAGGVKVKGTPKPNPNFGRGSRPKEGGKSLKGNEAKQPINPYRRAHDPAKQLGNNPLQIEGAPSTIHIKPPDQLPYKGTTSLTKPQGLRQVTDNQYMNTRLGLPPDTTPAMREAYLRTARGRAMAAVMTKPLDPKRVEGLTGVGKLSYTTKKIKDANKKK